MALRYDLTKIKEYEARCYEQPLDHEGKPLTDEKGEPMHRLNPTVEYLIYMTMFIGLGEIGKQNAQEFFSRTLFYERAFGSPRPKNVGDDEALAHAIDHYIGLSTNASRMSEDEFIEHIWDCFKQECPNVHKKDVA